MFLILSKTCRLTMFSFLKAYSIGIKGQSELSGLCHDIRAVLSYLRLMKWKSCESFKNTGICKVRSHTQSVLNILLQICLEFVPCLQNRICHGIEAYILENKKIYNGSHFCNENNGKFALGWVFFLLTKLNFFGPFLTDFLCIIQKAFFFWA